MLLKFRCEQVDRSGPVGSAVTLTPIFVSDEGRPLTFAAGTPRGKLLLEELTPAAVAQFSQGGEYLVEITTAPAAAVETNAAAGETKAPEGETPAT